MLKKQRLIKLPRIINALVAQLVEQRTCNAQVVGSIPIDGSSCRLGRLADFI